MGKKYKKHQGKSTMSESDSDIPSKSDNNDTQKNPSPDVQKAKSASKDKILELIEPYMKKFDKKLEEMLDEFDTYDYTYKPLLNQVEFEEEFLILIRKLFRRTNKYELIYTIFEQLLLSTQKDLHKVLCLIDFMINISRFNPTVFKKLPNEVVSTISDKPIFLKIQDYLYNKGRMNYQFKNFSKSRNVVEIDDNVQDTSTLSLKGKKTVESESDVSDSDNDDEPKKVMDVSLAELTKKIMSKTKKIPPAESEYNRIKKEESDNEDAILLDNYESESSQYSSDETEDESEEIPQPQSDDNDEDYEVPTRTRKSRTGKTTEAFRLEGLVESDSSEYVSAESDLGADAEGEAIRKKRATRSNNVQKLRVPGQDLSSDVDMDDVDQSMDAVTSILEHNMDYSQMGTFESSRRRPEFSSFRVEKVKLNKRRKVDPTISKLKLSKSKKLKPPQSRPKKPKTPKKPTVPSLVKRKTYYVVEKTLDFLYDELQHRIPKCSTTLLKKGVKGFSYKPAQYSLFTNLSEEETGMDETIRKNTDDLINTFMFQMCKKCGGNSFDKVQYVHPFEYDYIMENFESIKEKGVQLPPIIFTDRFSSLFDYENNINRNISLLRIKNTKIKSLLQIKVFESEDEYLNVFKKIVPRDQVAARISFLNKLVTDGVSLYVFDLIDRIRELMVGNVTLTVDSEEDELLYTAKMKMQESLELTESANNDNSLATNESAPEPTVNSEKPIEEPNTETSIVGSQGAMEAPKKVEVQPENIDATNGLASQTEKNEVTMEADHVTGTDEVIKEVENRIKTKETGDQNENKGVSEVLESDKPNSTLTGSLPNSEGHVDGQNPEEPANNVMVDAAENTSVVDPDNGKSTTTEVSVENMTPLAVERTSTETPSTTNILAPTETTDASEATDAIEVPAAIVVTAAIKVTDPTEASDPTYVPPEEESAADDQTVNSESMHKEPPRLIEITENKTKYDPSNAKTNVDFIPDDEREAVYCSAKGIHIPSKTVKKVLSSEECFNLLASILFPKFKLNSNFEGIPIKSLAAISCSYAGFRPYLLALFLDDVFEFIRLPRYFKVDSTMFELQIQYMLKSTSPASHIKNHSVSH